MGKDPGPKERAMREAREAAYAARAKAKTREPPVKSKRKAKERAREDET